MVFGDSIWWQYLDVHQWSSHCRKIWVRIKGFVLDYCWWEFLRFLGLISSGCSRFFWFSCSRFFWTVSSLLKSPEFRGIIVLYWISLIMEVEWWSSSLFGGVLFPCMLVDWTLVIVGCAVFWLIVAFAIALKSRIKCLCLDVGVCWFWWWRLVVLWMVVLFSFLSFFSNHNQNFFHIMLAQSGLLCPKRLFFMIHCDHFLRPKVVFCSRPIVGQICP